MTYRAKYTFRQSDDSQNIYELASLDGEDCLTIPVGVRGKRKGKRYLDLRRRAGTCPYYEKVKTYDSVASGQGRKAVFGIVWTDRNPWAGYFPHAGYLNNFCYDESNPIETTLLYECDYETFTLYVTDKPAEEAEEIYKAWQEERNGK